MIWSNVTHYTSEMIIFEQITRLIMIRVVISRDIKPNNKFIEVVKIVNTLLGFIRTFDFKSEKVIITLYYL